MYITQRRNESFHSSLRSRDENGDEDSSTGSDETPLSSSEVKRRLGIVNPGNTLYDPLVRRDLPQSAYL